jgi:hypothetical protein
VVAVALAVVADVLKAEDPVLLSLVSGGQCLGAFDELSISIQ